METAAVETAMETANQIDHREGGHHQPMTVFVELPSIRPEVRLDLRFQGPAGESVEPLPAPTQQTKPFPPP